MAIVVDHHAIIQRNYDSLVQSIDLTYGLLGHMKQISQLENFCTEIANVTSANIKVGSFLALLFDLEQHALDKVIPELVGALEKECQEHVANLLTGVTDGKRPMSQINLNKFHRNLDKFHQFIDVSVYLLGKLVSNGVLLRSDIGRVKSKDTIWDKADELIEIVARKSDCTFELFKETLVSSSQEHVVFILTDGDEGIPPLRDDRLKLLNKERASLIGAIEPGFSLIDEMVSHGAFTDYDKDRVRALKTTHKMNAEIIDIMSRKSDNSFDAFIRALDATGQKHVANVVRDNPGLSVDVAGVNPDVPTSISEVAELEIQQALVRQISDQTSDLSREFASEGLANPTVVRNCIKLKFNLSTQDLLDRLLHMIQNGRLDETLTNTCKEVLNKHGLRAIRVQVNQPEVDEYRRKLSECQLMSPVHKRALKTSTDELYRLDVQVDKRLLAMLDLDEQQVDYLLGKSDADKIENLLDIISRRPDSAFDELVGALRSTGQPRAAKALEQACEGDELGNTQRRRTVDCVTRRDGSAGTPKRVSTKRTSERYLVYNRAADVLPRPREYEQSPMNENRLPDTAMYQHADQLREIHEGYIDRIEKTLAQHENRVGNMLQKFEVQQQRANDVLSEVHKGYINRTEKIQTQLNERMDETNEKHNSTLLNFGQQIVERGLENSERLGRIEGQLQRTHKEMIELGEKFSVYTKEMLRMQFSQNPENMLGRYATYFPNIFTGLPTMKEFKRDLMASLDEYNGEHMQELMASLEDTSKMHLQLGEKKSFQITTLLRITTSSPYNVLPKIE